ncbi:winged helix-turn-helix transcriptional regulator [Oscillospiraceae bacterium OttesenSCG-928-F05]|nr:winged helix-turn-helix transcriptional regulator [Oscillospiraceae bacterium OttesenSCG-928-F05]
MAKSTGLSGPRVTGCFCGLVCRVQYQEMPVRVEYSVTEMREQLVPAFRIIGEWSVEMLENGQATIGE